MRIEWQQALAWRMRRQQLDPVGSLPVADVVARLCGVHAQVASAAELAVRVRRETSRQGEVERGLRDGRLIKTWAMRGTLHVFKAEEAGAFLSLMAAGRSWEKPSWQRHFDMTPARWNALRDAVRDALAEGPLTREQLGTEVTQRRGLRHVGEALGSSWGTLLKPLAWQGDLCVGPSYGARVTFELPQQASARWRPLPDPKDAAPVAIAAYLRAYGPTTFEAFANWLAGGYFGKRKVRSWFDALRDRMVEVDLDGEHAYVLAEDLDELAGTRPTRTVRLLPAFDQYVLGPGTGHDRVVPAARRSAVSRQAGWISPVVVASGVVSGTWELDGGVVRIAWFREGGRPPRTALRAEVARLASILERELLPEIGVRD